MVALADLLRLKRVAAQMIAEHRSARSLFERLGFRIQAFLPNWVEDREHQWRDLLLMAREAAH